MVTREEILQVLGSDTPDSTILSILATGASLEDLECANQWLNSRDDILGKSGLQLTGAAARVYDILKVEEANDERDR